MKELGSFEAAYHKAIKDVSARKEEILRAFYAKYGFEPDRYVMLEFRADAFDTKIVIKRLDELEYDYCQQIGNENKALRQALFDIMSVVDRGNLKIKTMSGANDVFEIKQKIIDAIGPLIKKGSGG